LYDSAVDQQTTGTTIRAWKPQVPGIREVFHARFREHAYPLHTHDTWTLFIVDDGAVNYDLDGHARGTDTSGVGVLPPHVVHDGRGAGGRAFTNRVLYLEPDVIGEELIGAAVDQPMIPDRSLRAGVAMLNEALACRDDALEAETRLAFVAERVRAAFGLATQHRPRLSGGRRPSTRRRAEALRAYFDANTFESVSLAAAVEELGSTPTQLARAFASVFGIPPHAYVMGRRLDAARDRILRGQRLADVAADVGFVDQAHLTRRFKQFLGTTPGRFARS
jgi:AraC-like DNA-binding protein